MADKFFRSLAAAVAQTATVQVTGFDATTTYKLTINGVDIVAVLGDTDADGTATAIQVAWEASAEAYATGITASVATDTVTLTADVAEVPFTVSSSVTGGTGTIGSVTAGTTSAGPHTLTSAANWGGTLPSNDDRLIFEGATPIAWDLGGLTTTGHTLVFASDFEGAVGLNTAGFATSADGQTISSTPAPEYRTAYLTIDAAVIEIGQIKGAQAGSGSGRLMIDNDRASASATTIYTTRNTATDTGKTPVRLLYAHADADIEMLDGVVGVGVDSVGEAATIGDVVCRAGRFITGDAVTISNFASHGGNHRLQIETAGVTLVDAWGGVVVVDGDQTVGTIKAHGPGRVESNTSGTVTLAQQYAGGTLDFSMGKAARTITTVQLDVAGELLTDDDAVTITNLLEPDGPSRLSVSAL